MASRSRAQGLLASVLRHHNHNALALSQGALAGPSVSAGTLNPVLNQARRQLASCSAVAYQLPFSLQAQQQQWTRQGFAARAFSTAEKKPEGPKEEKYDSLELTQEKIDSITDKIPQRPVGAVEGASYSLIIIAAFGVLIFIVWQFISNLILEPTAIKCFNATLDRLKGDPRITVRLGNSEEIRAWGSNSASRVGRQQIPHQIYKDANGKEHVRLQFYMKGPSGTGLVSADMYQTESGQWEYTYLLVDVYSGNSQSAQRVHIVAPR